MVKTYNPSSLKEFERTLKLTDQWARDLLDSMDWNKRKGQLRQQEKFMFQRAISTAVFLFHLFKVDS